MHTSWNIPAFRPLCLIILLHNTFNGHVKYGIQIASPPFCANVIGHFGRSNLMIFRQLKRRNLLDFESYKLPSVPNADHAKCWCGNQEEIISMLPAGLIYSIDIIVRNSHHIYVYGSWTDIRHSLESSILGQYASCSSWSHI